jgi:hypothetical protein
MNTYKLNDAHKEDEYNIIKRILHHTRTNMMLRC